MLPISSTRLDNGLGVVTVEQPHLHTTSVSLFVRLGSRHESDKHWGLSHFVEHMLFRGSARYPNARSIASALERYGGSLNAATWRDHTHLATPIHPSRLREALQVLGDMVQNPRFDDLEVERAIVEEELQGDLDEEGRDTDINNVSRASIWHGHPLGRRITGSLETLHSFSGDDVRRHHEQHYVAANSVLCVAGKVGRRQVEDLAEEVFRELPQGARTSDGAPARFSPSEKIFTRNLKASQLDVQLTFGALPDGHQDFPALVLLTRILDDGVTSRLHEAVVERKGLVYELTTGLDCYADCGVYDIELKVAPRRAASAVATTLDVLAELCAGGIRDGELELVKERSLHDLEFSCDSAEELASHYGAAALFHRAESLEEQSRKLMSVGTADVLRVARRIFEPQKLHATLLGPLERANMKRIEKLICGFAPPGTGGENTRRAERWCDDRAGLNRSCQPPKGA